jgi:hypothetical protein
MTKTKAKTLADFRANHDKSVIIPAKIRAALAALLAEGKENYEQEGEFTKRAGVSQTDMGRFREEFKDHVVETGGKAPKKLWFADKAVATKARNYLQA